MRIITALILMLLLTTPAAAQDDVVEEVEEIRRYTVEMIIFKYAQDVATGTEIFPGDEPVPAAEPLQQDPLFEEELPLEEVPVVFRDIELIRLTRDEYTMDEIMGRLERLEVYDPIMHFGWTQITWPEEETRPIELGSMARLPAGLDGNLTLYLGRYLHLVVDLQLDAPDSAVRDSPFGDRMSSFGDYRTLDGFGGIDEPGPVRYRIKENRILRSGELRYFDHPKFGVLAKATRVEEEEEEPPELEETELLGYPPD
jgi:hypothetical protein